MILEPTEGEWCATGVESHEFFFGEEEGSEEKTKDFLDKMPKEISEQYSKRNLKPNSLPDFSKMGENNAMMKNYDENGDFIMKSLDDIKFSNPLMFLTLKAMKINGLISTLIKSEGVVHALLGIENPTKHVDSLELLHAISEFVIYRIDRDRDLIKEYLVDALTGVNSARYIDFWKKNCEPEMPFTVIVADCNYLKQYNDLYGHECGDLLLSKSGEIFKSCAPKGCRIIRSGGDEFLLLCDNTDEKEAAKVIEAIRKAASKDNVKGYPISIALGSYTTNDVNFSFEEARAIADGRMYQNKSTMKDHQECTPVK